MHVCERVDKLNGKTKRELFFFFLSFSREQTQPNTFTTAKLTVSVTNRASPSLTCGQQKQLGAGLNVSQARWTQSKSRQKQGELNREGESETTTSQAALCQMNSQYEKPLKHRWFHSLNVNQRIKEPTHQPPTLSLSISKTRSNKKKKKQEKKNRDLRWINRQCFPDNRPLFH